MLIPAMINMIVMVIMFTAIESIKGQLQKLKLLELFKYYSIVLKITLIGQSALPNPHISLGISQLISK
jgi:hypothetical protein